MRTLLLIPSVLKTGIEGDVASGRHPRMDYYALADSISALPDGRADLLGYAEAERERSPVVRVVRRMIGRDAALAMLGFILRRDYDAIFTNGENVAIPLALLLKLCRRRPGHVTIGHRLSSGKKRLFYRLLKAHRQMDTIFVYASSQFAFARTTLRIPASKLSLIAFHADTRFFRPMPEIPVDPDLICSAGLEWRDYPTLIEAVKRIPDSKVKLAAASPWSKHQNETSRRELPPNVDARRYDYSGLRDLYAQSSFVVVPLYENDFQAGVTTILEAMAMGKAVIATRTTGQTDVIADEENGLTVPPGDAAGLARAIMRLRADRRLRDRIASAAVSWMVKNATLEAWASRVVEALSPSRNS